MIADEEVSNVLIESCAPPARMSEDIGEHVARLELVDGVPANKTDRLEEGHLAQDLPVPTIVPEKSSVSAPTIFNDELGTVATIKERSARKRRQGSKSTINDLFSKL